MIKGIKISKAEKQSGVDRIRIAEGLITQLPNSHEGRNTWLMNYGRNAEAVRLRSMYGMVFDPTTQSAVTKAVSL